MFVFVFTVVDIFGRISRRYSHLSSSDAYVLFVLTIEFPHVVHASRNVFNNTHILRAWFNTVTSHTQTHTHVICPH